MISVYWSICSALLIISYLMVFPHKNSYWKTIKYHNFILLDSAMFSSFWYLDYSSLQQRCHTTSGTHLWWTTWYSAHSTAPYWYLSSLWALTWPNPARLTWFYPACCSSPPTFGGCPVKFPHFYHSLSSPSLFSQSNHTILTFPKKNEL